MKQTGRKKSLATVHLVQPYILSTTWECFFSYTSVYRCNQCNWDLMAVGRSPSGVAPLPRVGGCGFGCCFYPETGSFFGENMTFVLFLCLESISYRLTHVSGFGANLELLGVVYTV